MLATGRRGEAPERAAKRLFFAVSISDEIAGEARATAAALADRDDDDSVRWIPVENYHITLRFLGETAVAEIPRLVSEVRRESASRVAFRATLGPLLLLPTERQPRMIALEVDSEGQLERLAECVERGVCRAGVAPCERPFRPHLTLGRTRRGRRFRADRFGDAVFPSHASFLVDAALLIESELSRQGARYFPVERVALGVSNHPH